MKAFKFFVYLAVFIGAVVVLWNSAHAVTPSEFWCGFKRVFYAVIIPYIFLLVARVLWAIAKYFEAKTRRISDE